ncbi:MAG TPA: alpha/beta hydrolase domain-containing protein [Caulobacteraceae bacterium]
MIRVGLSAAAIALAVSGLPARAAVERVEITERTVFAPGVSFGEVGPYEKIRGIATFALDPDAPANAAIVDLKLAPRDGRGRVMFQSEFVMLRPIRARSSILLYDVNNRGGMAILGQMNGRSPANNDPTTAADAGDGFLMRHGFTLLSSAWTWDVAPQPAGAKPLVFTPPVAKGPYGAAITGPVENEFRVDAPARLTTYAGMRGLTYEPATPNDPSAVLTTRTRPDDPRTPIRRDRWRFVAPEQPGGPGRVEMDGGFAPGTIYELTYRAKDPFVTGAGLAGIRDLLAFFRDHPFAGAPASRRVLIFGISQSARLIGRMLHDGLDVDETGRLAFDGAFMEVPGAGGSAGFNSRFAQPTRHPSMLEEHDYPSDAFPFTTAPTRDPATGAAASLLDNARDAAGRTPKLLIANTSTEFWNRDASLIATTPDGARDVAPAAGVRIYAFMGAQHYVGRSRTRLPYVNCVSTTDHYLAVRALIVALDRWVGSGERPPASAYPSLSDGTLVAVGAYRAAFPRAIGLTPPWQSLAESRLDFGPRFAGEGIADRVPPGHGVPFATRVPAPDGDGNDKGGVRLVELRAPLGTHTGWNQRAPQTGFAWATARFDGSFLPFARTEAERLAAGDPRPSLAERYPTRAAFEAKAREAAARQVAAGFLLPEDVGRAVAENLGLYDRILAHDPGDRSCGYLFPG